MNNLWFLILLLSLQYSVCSSNSWKKRRRRDEPEKEYDAYGRVVYPKRSHTHRSEHPELRVPQRTEEDGISEFVRREYSETAYKKVRTYSSIPRQIECYSCMSLSYQTSWKYLQATYFYPKVFTDRCRDPANEKGMPTVSCSSVCISLLEPDIEAGVFIGYKHIRGCLDRVLRSGFNQTALRTHRFHQNNQCRTLSRGHLFNPAKPSDPPAIGEVQLCSCYGDRCNPSSFAFPSVFMYTLLLVYLFIR